MSSRVLLCLVACGGLVGVGAGAVGANATQPASPPLSGTIVVFCGDELCPATNGVFALPVGTIVRFEVRTETSSVVETAWDFGDGIKAVVKGVGPVRHAYRASPPQGYAVTAEVWHQLDDSTRKKQVLTATVLVTTARGLSNGPCLIAGFIPLAVDQMVCSGLNNLIGAILGYFSRSFGRR